MPAALLLDMDGTLVDSEPVHIRAHTDYLASRGVPVTHEDLVGNIGKGDLVFYRDLAARAGVPCDPAVWVAEKTELLHRLYRRDRLAVQPGVQDLLDRAWVEGVACCVVSNSSRESVRLALESAGLAPRLPARVCFEDTVAHKPDPAPYLLASSRLACPPARCTVIEDSPSGVRAGRAAGARVIAVAGLVPAATLAKAGAHLVVTSLAALAWGDLEPRR